MEYALVLLIILVHLVIKEFMALILNFIYHLGDGH